MAFRKKYLNEIFGSVLVLSALLSTASAVDCFGKSFHCVNSTHFMICVDLGGGVSQSIDDFLIPCPPPTVCQGNNHFECEYPAVTTPPTTLRNVISETTEPWEEIVVTTNTPPKKTSTTKEYSEKYMNTVSITTVNEDNLTTDTTVDSSVVTEASSLNDVNSNFITTETVLTSASYDAITGLDGKLEKISDNIVTVPAEITTDLPQVFPVRHLKNDTNETITDHVTLSFSVTESAIMLNNKNGLASNVSAGDEKKFTVTDLTDSITSKNVFQNTVTPDTLLVDSNNGTRQPLTTITDENFITGVNLEVTTAQTLDFTDGLQNSVNPNIQTTTPEPVTAQNTVGVEQFQITLATGQIDSVTSKNVFENTVTPDTLLVDSNNGTEQPLTTITDKSFATGVNLEKNTEQTLVSTDGLQKSVKSNIQTTTPEPATVQNTVDVEQFQTPVFGQNLITDSVQNFTIEQSTVITPVTENVSTQVPITTSQSTVIEYIATSVNVKDEASGDPTLHTEQSPTTIHEDKFSTAAYGGYTTEAPLIIITNGKQDKQNFTESDKVPTQMTDGTIIYKGGEQSTVNIKTLTTNIDVTTAPPTAFTTDKPNPPITEPANINKDSLATQAVQKPIDTGIELLIPSRNKSKTGNDVVLEQSGLPKKTQRPIENGAKQSNSSTNSFAIDVNTLTENPSELTSETEKRLGTEPLNNTALTNSDDRVTEASVLPTELQKPIHSNIEQSSSANSLAADNNSITENPSEFTTETQTQVVTDQSTINNNSGDSVLTKASVLPTEDLNPLHIGVEQSTITTKSVPTENPSTFSRVTQNPINVNNGRPATINNELVTNTDVATEKATVSATGIHEPTKPITEEKKPILVVTEQPTTNKNLATDNATIVEKASVEIAGNSSDFTAKAPNEKVTEGLAVTENSIDAATEYNVLPTETQKPIHSNIEQSPSSNSLATDNNAITENPNEVTTETYEQLITEQVEQPTVNNNGGNNMLTETSVLPAQDLNLLQMGVEQSTITTKSVPTENPNTSSRVTKKSINVNTERPATINNELVTNTDVATEKASVSAMVIHEPTKPIIEEKKPILVVTEQSTTNKNLATDNATIAEKIAGSFSDFTVKAPKQKVTEGLTVNENSIDPATEESVLSTESQKPIHSIIEQPSSSNSLAADKSISDNPSEFTTETHKQLVTEPPIINNNSGNNVLTETSVLPTQDLKPVHMGVEQLTITTKSVPTEIASASTRQTKKPINMNTEQPATIKNEVVTNTDVATEKASVFATGTQETIKPILEEKPILVVTEQPTTDKNLAIDNAAIAEKASVAITGNSSDFTTNAPKQKVTEGLAVSENSIDAATEESVLSTESQKPIHSNTEQPSSSSLAADNSISETTAAPKQRVTDELAVNENSIDAPTEASVLRTQTQKSIYTTAEQQIATTKSLATDKDMPTENLSAFEIKTQNTIYMSSQQPNTKKNSLASDIAATTEKASVSASDLITEVQKSTSASIEQSTTIKDDFATDIGLPKTGIVSVMATTKSTTLLEEEVSSGLSDTNIETGQQQENLIADTIVRSQIERNIVSSAKITTDATIMQNTGITKEPIAGASDNVEADTNTLNISKLHNNTSTSNNGTIVTEIVESINITTTEPTRNIYDNLDATTAKEDTVTITNNIKTSDNDIVNIIPVDNVQTIITEQSHKNTFDVTSGTVDSLIPTTAKNVDVKKDEATLNVESNVNNGQQEITLSTLQDKTDLTNGVTRDTSLNIENEIIAPVIDSANLLKANAKEITTSAFGITEVNYLNQETKGPTTQYIRGIVENIGNNHQTTESNLKDTRIQSITTSTTTQNINGHDVGIFNEDTVNGVVNKTERVNLITAEEVGENYAQQLPAPVIVDLGKETITILNGVNDSLDTNLQEDINNYSKNSNLEYSGQVFGGDATSETTATDKFTPSLNPANKDSQQNVITPSNQLTTENTNIVIDNVADGTSSFSGISSTTFKDEKDDLSVLLTENRKIDTTLASLNTQDNSYVGSTAEKSTSSYGNVANNPDALSTINENVAHKIVQSSTKTDDFKSNPVENANNNVNDVTTTRRVIENKGTTIAEKSTTSDDIQFELHISNENNIVQHVEETTNNVQPTHTISPVQNEHANNLISNPLTNILLDKINQVVNSSTENSASFSTNNERKINNVYVLSTATVSVMADSSTQIPLVQNTNDVTSQGSVPAFQTKNNSPLSRLDNPSVADDLQKTSQVASVMVTENPSGIQPKTTTFKAISVPKEELFTNDRDDAIPLDLSPSVPATKSTTEFSILEGVQKVTIGNYFNTPSETSTSGNININANGDIPSIHSTYDIQDSSKTSSSIYNIESSITGKNDNLLISKLGLISTASNLPSSVNDNGVNSKTTKIEMSIETSTNNVASNTVLNKPEISEPLPEPNYKIDINTANVNQQIPNKPYGILTSETKISTQPYSSTSNPSKVVTSAIYQYGTAKSDINTSFKISGTTVSTPIDVSQQPSSQQAVNGFKTDAKSLPGKSNEQKVASNLINTDKTNVGSTTTLGTKYKNVSQLAISESSNNVTNAANPHNYSKLQTDSAITSSNITEKAGSVTNTTEAKNSEIIKIMLKNNGSTGSWKTYQEKNVSMSDIVSKNVPQGINKNKSTSTQNYTNTAKSNTQGDLKPQQKLSTNPTSHIAEPVKSTAPRHETIYPVTITTQVFTANITPRPVVLTTTTTTENIRKQIPKTVSPASFSCISGVRGRYSDKDDCRKFYICIGNSQPIVGNCPANTVFSDISKLCTKNLSHCIRENEFKCPSPGRFSDAIQDNAYYICVSHKNHYFRFKFQCQKGFTLNKATIRCIENKVIESNASASISLIENSSDGSIRSSSSASSSSSSGSSSMSTSRDSSGSSSLSTSSDSTGSSSSSTDNSSSDSSNGSGSSSDSSNNSDSSALKSKNKNEIKEKKQSKEKSEGRDEDDDEEVFDCEKEGKFPVRNDCRRYYLCKKNGKSEYRRKIKKCESGDVFHKDKKNSENSNESNDSENDSDRHHSNRRQRKKKKEETKSRVNYKEEVFECEREGKFPIPGDCRRFYLCKRNRKSEYRRKIKKCDSDEVFHKSRKKCVDAESYEC